LPTVRAALETLEASLFVDRREESEVFARWLASVSPHPSILQVTGHAGVGKSALLRAFARMAAEAGRKPVIYVDGDAIAPTADDFAKAVTGDGIADPASFLGGQSALLMIDGIEALGPLTRWLTTTFMPSLSPNVRVVIAARQPVGQIWKPLLKTMQTLRLESLPQEQAAEYLDRRGVAPGVAAQIINAAGGYPLALTMAADLAIQRRVTRFEKAPQWHLMLRGLVDQLVTEAPDLRSLLEAAAVVRQFDESTLAALTGLSDAGQAFSELCRASFVRPAQHGLTLHQDVRRVVIEELQWRNPQRLAQLRSHARTYFSDRIRARRPGEEWLVAERLYLWDNTAHASFFPSGEPWTMWVETGGPGDIEELLAIQSDFVARQEAGPQLPGLPPPEECSADLLRAFVAMPGTEIYIARSPDGYGHAYRLLLPVSGQLLALLPPEGAMRAVVERGLPTDVRRALPATGEGSLVSYMTTIALRGERALEAGGAIAADSFRSALRGGTFVLCAGDEVYALGLQALGATRIPDVGTSTVGAPVPLDGYVLEIGRAGPDAWLESVTSGRPMPPGLSAEQLEKELHQVLVHWPNDGRLAESPLAQLAMYSAPLDGGTRPAEHLRNLIRRAVADVRANGTDEGELAGLAIELAYFERKLAHEAIAERLNVSRSSFYRLLHRAERDIANRLTGGARTVED
jgi:hypothetical protein